MCGYGLAAATQRKMKVRPSIEPTKQQQRQDPHCEPQDQTRRGKLLNENLKISRSSSRDTKEAKVKSVSVEVRRHLTILRAWRELDYDDCEDDNNEDDFFDEKRYQRLR
mmetsp:Transcript_25403/g.51737  ORF Transcript_25403/g.51737 Transcript_25403/m.51737 type:complete len:109 (-) Transcript_25403:274-600(-)